MTGLILKDFLILRKTLRAYLLVLIVYAGIAFAGAWSADIVGVLSVVMMMLLPMNVFAYDKQAKWNVYGLALPVGRTKTVAARYLCVLLLCLFSMVLTAILGAALYAAGRVDDPLEFLVTCSAMGLMAMLINAILLPFLYRFGPERARILFIGVMGGVFLLVVLVLLPLGGLDRLKTLELAEPTLGQAAVVPAVAAMAGLALLALSFLLSRHFYGSQDI